MRIATFGSCFAQHIGRSMKERDFSWLNCEPAPPGLTPENAKKFNYGIFSARTGNIYTSSILLQWTEWALGLKAPPEEVWEKNGRFIDPFRPRIEPDGFASVDEMVHSRKVTIDRFRQCIEQADVFVFTLGLTESWFNRSGGYEYPLCPGTAAGTYDASQHMFVNQDYVAVRQSLVAALSLMRSLNPSLRFLLTVSPVPLVATAAGRHVLVSTMASKSILRAVAESVAGTTVDASFQPAPAATNWKEWAVYANHEFIDGGVRLIEPGSNPFYGVKRRSPISVVAGDKLVVRMSSSSPEPFTIHVSPELATRRGSVSALAASVDGSAEAQFEMAWSGNATVWVGSSAKGRPVAHELRGVEVEKKSSSDGLVDYFPSYEIINSPAFGGVFFEGDKREVSPYGVDFVMSQFFNGLGYSKGAAAPKGPRDAFDVVCDELILGSFSKAAE
jgi:hypothetical protein